MAVLLWWLLAQDPTAPRLQQRGFVETRFKRLPANRVRRQRRLVGEALWRHEISVALGQNWKLFAATDARTDSRNQTARDFAWNADDRTIRRPAFSLRRASLQYRRKWLTVEAGRQFIRWAKPTS